MTVTKKVDSLRGYNAGDFILKYIAMSHCALRALETVLGDTMIKPLRVKNDNLHLHNFFFFQSKSLARIPSLALKRPKQ